MIASDTPESDARSLYNLGASSGSSTSNSSDLVTSNPAFNELVGERTRFAWILTGLMLVVYFGFIGL
ncbi:DUF485 domain-containing protein, partial [Methylobacterium brachiatum]